MGFAVPLTADRNQPADHGTYPIQRTCRVTGVVHVLEEAAHVPRSLRPLRLRNRDVAWRTHPFFFVSDFGLPQLRRRSIYYVSLLCFGLPGRRLKLPTIVAIAVWDAKKRSLLLWAVGAGSANLTKSPVQEESAAENRTEPAAPMFLARIHVIGPFGARLLIAVTATVCYIARGHYC